MRSLLLADFLSQIDTALKYKGRRKEDLTSPARYCCKERKNEQQLTILSSCVIFRINKEEKKKKNARNRDGNKRCKYQSNIHPILFLLIEYATFMPRVPLISRETSFFVLLFKNHQRGPKSQLL